MSAIAVLPRLPRLGYWLSWVLVLETTADIVVGIIRKVHEPLWGNASGVTWLILDIYVPFLLTCLPLLIWQLVSSKPNQKLTIPNRERWWALK
jgi:hypothetical protein